mmetsp:Transcript_51531/g.115755  ORF Transcript_51531/g.115755 Transcript_51531/m.115755 type:complete len:272 (+) Transcript_51531:1189-2004(+)
MLECRSSLLLSRRSLLLGSLFRCHGPVGLHICSLLCSPLMVTGSCLELRHLHLCRIQLCLHRCRCLLVLFGSRRHHLHLLLCLCHLCHRFSGFILCRRLRRCCLFRCSLNHHAHLSLRLHLRCLQRVFRFFLSFTCLLCRCNLLARLLLECCHFCSQRLRLVALQLCRVASRTHHLHHLCQICLRLLRLRLRDCFGFPCIGCVSLRLCSCLAFCLGLSHCRRLSLRTCLCIRFRFRRLRSRCCLCRSCFLSRYCCHFCSCLQLFHLLLGCL